MKSLRLAILMIYGLCITAPLQGKELKVLIFGDFGTGTIFQYRVAQSMYKVCQSSGCDMGLLLGDNFYERGVRNLQDPIFRTRFEQPYGPLGIPFYVALGNHDYRGNVQAQVDYTKVSKFWNLPARYYDFVKENTQFVGLDTNRFDEKQAQYLESVLSRSSSAWKVVFAHHPPISYGSHGSDTKLQKTLLPIICKHQVLYFAGHDHDLQFIKPDCGARIIISGAAAKVREVQPGTMSKFAQSTLGYTRLEIAEQEARIQFYNAKTNSIIYTENLTTSTKEVVKKRKTKTSLQQG
ncbi:MAG: metallophosphoesterase [Zetaproteobacteria bacterium]|nr:metallophosphoesterase [Zetaproteobacteria bacterium]